MIIQNLEGQDVPPLFTYSGYQEAFDDFFKMYTIDFVQIIPQNAHPSKLKARNQRTCRYCNRTAPSATFRKRAHVIPSLLGNKHLLSDYECDDCNNLFSRFETSLAAYIGLMRTVTSLSRGNNIPKHRVHNSPVTTHTIKLGEQDKDVVCFTFHKEPEKTDKGVIISFKKESYTPINVYKILLKMALSIMPQQDIDKYSYLMNFIINDEHSQLIKPFASNVNVITHGFMADPHIYIFKKRRDEDDVPTHIFMFCYEDTIYQLPVPANSDDQRIYQDGKQLTFPYCPPILFEPPLQNATITGGNKNFSSYDAVQEEGKLMLHFETSEELSEQSPLHSSSLEEYLKGTSGSKLIIARKTKDK